MHLAVPQETLLKHKRYENACAIRKARTVWHCTGLLRDRNRTSLCERRLQAAPKKYPYRYPNRENDEGEKAPSTSLIMPQSHDTTSTASRAGRSARPTPSASRRPNHSVDAK